MAEEREEEEVDVLGRAARAEVWRGIVVALEAWCAVERLPRHGAWQSIRDWMEEDARCEVEEAHASGRRTRQMEDVGWTQAGRRVRLGWWWLRVRRVRALEVARRAAVEATRVGPYAFDRWLVAQLGAA